MDDYTNLAVKTLSQNIKRAVDVSLSTAHFDITLQGRVKEKLDNNYYNIEIDGKEYPIKSELFLKVNDFVNVLLPQNNPSNMLVYVYKPSETCGEFEFVQSTAKTTWVITHNLNKYPNVIIMDNNGTQILQPVVYTDKNNIKITFSSATAGRAILR